jgi:ABC-type glutathione transport system ATPase component
MKLPDVGLAARDDADLASRDEDGEGSVLVRLEKVSRSYRTQASFFRHEAVQALRSVDLEVYEGEILALLGQSGSGKSTLGRIVVRLARATSGNVWFRETDVNRLSGRALREFRKSVGIVFQDPYSSLNPRMTVGAALAEPLRVWNVVASKDVESEVERLLANVAIPTSYITRFPHALSGGERQRVAIARALAVGPEFLVADEAVSALDVASAAEILNLLLDLHARLKLTVLFATHDIGAARVVSDRVAVMQHGEIVELSSTSELLADPKHDYTRLLLRSELRLPERDWAQES